MGSSPWYVRVEGEIVHVEEQLIRVEEDAVGGAGHGVGDFAGGIDAAQLEKARVLTDGLSTGGKQSRARSEVRAGCLEEACDLTSPMSRAD